MSEETVDTRTPINLMVVVCTNRDWKVEFGASIIDLVAKIQDVGEGFVLKRFMVQIKSQSSFLSMSREEALQEAIEQGFTHLLMLDDDMTFPADTVKRLLAARKPFIGANYVKKSIYEFIAHGMDGKPLNGEGRTGVEEVMAIGLGVCLLELSVVKDIPAPHFAVPWDTQRLGYWGEDFFFCGLLKRNGIQTWVDSDLSREIGHVGSCTYRIKK